MFHHQQHMLPQLLTLDKANNDPSKSVKKKNSEQKYGSKAQQIKKNLSELQQSNRELLVKVEVNNRRLKVVDDDKLRANKRSNQISKNLINEIMNKITSKSVSEDNYPISNETVQRLLFDLENQIKGLKIQLGKFKNSLLLNPSNQNLKREKETVENNLNKLQTIKQLYNQKIETRNKISQLQVKIMELKNENKQLKIKIARGIQKIESHIHNLPCQRQKLLIEEVNKYKISLDRQKQMRQNLELNIQTIKLNCKNFYEEVEQARKVVYEQLQQIKKRECEITAKEQKMRNHKCEIKTDNRSIKGENLLGGSQIFLRKMTNKLSEQQNLAEIINKINLNQFEQGLKRTKTNNSKMSVVISSKTKDKEGLNNNAAIINFDNGIKSKFNLQEQIEKMRMNQSQFNKITKKNFMTND